MKTRFNLLLALSIVLLALPAFANNFRAADIVYLNAAGHVAGGGGALFQTDVVITNVSTGTVEVDAAFLGTGGADARGGLDPSKVERVATLEAGESILIEDIVLEVFNNNAGFGHMIFFSCRVGGNCNACDSNAADCLPIVVEARIYDAGNPTATFGQLFPGYPWYSYASSAVADRGLGEAWVTGIRQNSRYRSNLGFANASEFSTTTLNVTLYRNDGTLVSTQPVTLGPLGHRQINVASLFPGFSGNGYVIVEQPATGVVPTNPDSTDPFIASGAPGFYTYGSVLDNATNDPTTLEPVFPVEFDYVQVYGKAGKTGRAVSRPD